MSPLRECHPECTEHAHWLERINNCSWPFSLKSEEREEGMQFPLLPLSPSPGWACVISKQTSKKNFFFIGTDWGKVELKPCRHLSFWNLLLLCITNTHNVQDFALYDAHLETSQWYFSVKPWGEVAFLGSCMGTNLLAEIQKVEGGWKIVNTIPWS